MRNILNETIPMDSIIVIANKVVTRYAYRKVIPWREKEDVVMDIVEKFLAQKDKIEKAFEGKSKKQTYFIAILNRMCCEVIRKESKHWYSINEGEDDRNLSWLSTSKIDAEKRVALRNETSRLANTMLFFNGSRAKVNLFLKYYFDLPISENEIMEYSGENMDLVSELIKREDAISKADVFENLSKIVNIVEGKNVKGDAVRMWLNKQMDTILSRMNSNDASYHNKETLALLFELQSN
ncbi:MAG: hypothetical protein ACLFNU_07840 [Bacteroidales bacterium]